MNKLIFSLTIILTIILLVIPKSIVSQKNTFSISGRTQYIPELNNFNNRTYQSYSIKELNDSLLIKTYYKGSSIYEYIYSAKLGYELIGNIKFNITDRLILKTGLGLNFISFNTNSEVYRFESEQLSIDTIPKTTSTPVTPSSSTCDNYINSFFDLREIQKGIDYEIISLKVPLEINHLFLSNKLNLGLGVFIQTPLYSTKTEEYITTEREESNGITSCKYVIITRKDKSGNSLNNLQMGLSGNVSYKILKNIAFEIGITKEFRNVFYQDENNQSGYFLSSSNFEYNPYKLHLGLEYLFGKKEKNKVK